MGTTACSRSLLTWPGKSGLSRRLTKRSWANTELLVAQTTLQNIFCLVWVDNQSKSMVDILRFEDIN